MLVAFAASDDGARVARTAQAITVSIEGAVQGSGVLVEKVGNRYTVLTAWHVIGDNRPGEEVIIATADGQSHQGDTRTMQRLASDVDLGVISFEAPKSYQVAFIGDSRAVAMGEKIYVAGFPLPTSAVPARLLRFLNGDVQANATMAIPNGYQLLYSNPTLPGMSGGAVLNSKGELVGIHGQGETVDKATENQNVFVKTGTNQAVPIAFFREFQQAAALLAKAASALPTASVRPVAKAVQALATNLSSSQPKPQPKPQAQPKPQPQPEPQPIAAAPVQPVEPQPSPAPAPRPVVVAAAPAPAPAAAPAPKPDPKPEPKPEATTQPQPGAAAPVAVAKPAEQPTLVAKASSGSPTHAIGPLLPPPGPSKLMRQSRPDTVDDYVALARQLFSKRGNEKQIIELMRDSIALKPTYLAYFYRAKAKHDSGDVVGAMNDYNEALKLNPKLGAGAKKRGQSVGESIQNRAMAMRLAMERLPQGAAVIDKKCQDIQMGPDNYKHRCVVDYTTDGMD